MDYKKLGRDLLPLVGGAENISKLTHCATRLRFEFCDRSRVDEAAIKSTPGVISVVEKGGQFQVVVGNDVPITYEYRTCRNHLYCFLCGCFCGCLDHGI